MCTVRTVEEVEISSTSSMKAVRRTTQPIAFPAQVTKLQPPRITSRQAYGIIGRTLVASLAACLGSTNATHEQPQRTIATHVYQGLAACQLSANRDRWGVIFGSWLLTCGWTAVWRKTLIIIYSYCFELFIAMARNTFVLGNFLEPFLCSRPFCLRFLFILPYLALNSMS